MHRPIIIQGAVHKIASYESVKDILIQLGITSKIEKVYLKANVMYDKLTPNEKETIDALSRWYGHNADDLLILQNRSNQTLQHLKTHIEKDGVEVVWVARK